MKAYYSRQALELAEWAHTENNRLKGSRILKAAYSIEERYRENHKDIVADPYTRPLIVIPSPPNRGSAVVTGG